MFVPLLVLWRSLVTDFIGRRQTTGRSRARSRQPGVVVDLRVASPPSGRTDHPERRRWPVDPVSAVAALAAHPMGAAVGVLHISAGRLVAQFDGGDRPLDRSIKPPIPWSFDDGAQSWSTAITPLAAGVDISQDPGNRRFDSKPTLIALSEELWVDFAVVRRLALVGPAPEIGQMVASMATSVGAAESGPILVAGYDKGPTLAEPTPDALAEPTPNALAEPTPNGGVVVVVGQTVPHGWSGWTITRQGGATAVDVPIQQRDSETKLQLRLLGPVEVSGGLTGLTTQQLSIVAFLGCVESAHRSAIVDAVWGGREVSNRRLANVLADIRSTIGKHRLPQPQQGRYRLDGVTSDLSTLTQCLAEARRQPTLARIEAVEQALGAVRGVPITAPHSRYWNWVDERVDVTANAELVVTEAAELVADEMMSRGLHGRAAKACNAGLLASPMHEDLVGMLMDAHRSAGRIGSAKRLAERWEVAARRMNRDWPLTGSEITPGAELPAATRSA